MVSEYTAYGLRMRSSVVLPFTSATGSAAGPDVTVRFGAAPPRLSRATRRNPPVWEAAPGVLLLHVEDVARFLVMAGREIVIEPCGGGNEDIVAFLLGPVFAALLQQREVVTLHAAAVETAAGAVLLLGGSGSGKSALAAALVERGCALLADNVTGVILDGSGHPTALPAFPCVQLWEDTLDTLCWHRLTRTVVRQALAKYRTPVERFCTSSLPVRAVYVLKSHNRPDFDIEPAPPDRVFSLFWENTYRNRMLEALGQLPHHFRMGTAMAQRVPVFRVTRPAYPILLATLADQIEAHLQHQSVHRPETRNPPGGLEMPPPPSRPPLRPRSRMPEACPLPGVVVWLAAYPKSGSTWLRAVLTNYLQDNGEPASIDALEGSRWPSVRSEFDESIGLDSSDLKPDEIERYLPRFRELIVEALFAARPGHEKAGFHRRGPNFARTHEAYRVAGGAARFPRGGTAGVVYLVRNPLDVAVSYAHHLQRSVGQVVVKMNNPNATEAGPAFGIGPLLPNPLTTWSGHVSSWLEQTDLRMHVARYEDLLADPQAGFGAIVRFAGLEWDEARLGRAIEHAAFPRLRAQEAGSGFSERPLRVPSFFRVGVAGSWRAALTPGQVRALVGAHGPVMKRLDYLREAEAFLRRVKTHGTAACG